MKIFKASFNDAAFLYDNLEVLRNGVKYSYDDFLNFYKQYLDNKFNSIFIASIKGENIGFITVNTYASLKYIGYTSELEEVIVLSEYRGLGLGKEMISLVIKELENNKLIRKTIVKTDDQKIAGRVYQKFMTLTEMRTYQLFLNKI